MKTRTLVTPVVTLALLFLISACGQQEGGKAKEKEAQAHLVKVAVAARRNLAPESVRTGTLRARREVRIYNQEEGRIEALPRFEGDRVAEGEELVVLDHVLLQAELDKVRAQRRQAEQDLKRIEGLSNKHLVSDDELARARTSVQVAHAEEALLATRLGYSTIRAPFAGVVTERLKEPGDIAPRYSHLLTLMDPDSLITEVPVSELLLPTLHAGDPVTIRIDALGAGEYAGRISRIHPTLDPHTRLGKVEIALEPVPAGARPGQLCRVRLAGSVAERLVIPFSALRRDADGEHLFIVDGEGKVARRAVKSGLRLSEEVEILEGLEAGERVVAKGFLGLVPGKAVSVVDDAAPAKPKGKLDGKRAGKGD